MKISLKIPIFLLLSIAIVGCSQGEPRISQQKETIVPSPTSTQTTMNTPKPSDTIEPTLTPVPTQTNTSLPPTEVEIQEIPLAGPIANPKAQISGMAWHGDDLVMLPQYPEKEPAAGAFPSLFVISKKEIVDYLDGSTLDPLTPTRVAFQGGALQSQIPGYEGYEAIAISGDTVYLTIEANDNGRMAGYLIEGEYLPDRTAIQIDPTSLTELPVPAQIFNYAFETLISENDKTLAIYEINGKELNPNPYTVSVDVESKSTEKLEFENIEYRVTDATKMDRNGRFWVVNIFIPIEFWLYTDSDPIFAKFGRGQTHSENIYVERLLELQYNGDKIVLTENEPIQLQLDEGLNSRNWEALVDLDNMGFLIMTDTYPDTILAFIPSQNNSSQ